MYGGILMAITRKVKIGGVTIGGGTDIAVQSMLSARHDDITGNVSQAIELERAGCEILRVAIPNRASVSLISAIKEKISIPLVADIHFDYKLAIDAVAAGIDKIRINPGNIGGDDHVKRVADVCQYKNIPIRIGINAGSLEKEILKKHGAATAEAMVESALYHASLLEKFDFDQIVISLKSSNIQRTVDACRRMAQMRDYPLHLGITEAGTSRMGLIRSSIGIGALLLDGIGDTLRVSLTAPPAEEILAARDILLALGKNKSGVTVISCPTCGRTAIDVTSLAAQAEEALKNCRKKLTVAVMGCVVNGPGEAREADVCICGGEKTAALFVRGKVAGSYPQEKIIPALLDQVQILEHEGEIRNA